MDFFVWDDRFVTGVGSIDEDHQVLLGLVNRLHNAMLTGTARKDIENIIDEMVRYTKSHFAREEDLMLKTQYSELAEHKLLHAHFVTKSIQFRDDFKSGKIGLSVAIFSFLKDWLSGHILDIDKNMVVELG